MKNILNDRSKLTDHEKILNHLVHMKNRVTDVLKNLKEKRQISNEQYKYLSLLVSRPEIIYGLAKLHKPLTYDLPSFRPILHVIYTSTYRLAKFLVPVLESLTTNEIPSYLAKNFKVSILNLQWLTLI